MNAVTHPTENVLPAADTKTLVRLLRGVERLPDGANGALIFGTKEQRWGTLLIEDKRVCWAAANGMETRLTDILRQQTEPPLEAGVIEQVFEGCREQGTPLGAALVARGLVTSAGLERALRQHTGEAVLRLSQVLAPRERIVPTWIPNRSRKYDAQFTFTATEILVCAGALGNEEVTPRAHRALAPVMEDSVVAAAFIPDDEDGEALPVAQVRGENVGVEGLVALGSWAIQALRDTAPFAATQRLVSITNASHQTAVAWNQDDIVYAALCEDRTSLSVLVARRARCLHG